MHLVGLSLHLSTKLSLEVGTNLRQELAPSHPFVRYLVRKTKCTCI